MSHVSDNTTSGRSFSVQRASTRHRLGSTVYIELVEGNGGIVLNISEGGLAVQAAMPLVDDQLPRMRFRFSSAQNWIETSGVIAWRSESKKLVGVKFVDLSDEARAQIEEWISAEVSGEHVHRDNGAPIPMAPPSGSVRPNGAPSAQNSAASDPASRNQFQTSNPASRPVTFLHAQPQTDAPPVPGVLGPDALGEDEPEELELELQNDTRSLRPASQDAAPGPRKLYGFGSRRAKVSRALLKRYLVDERHRIRLYDLISQQAELLCNELTVENFPANVPVTDEEFIKRIHRYEELTEELLSIIITGCFWGEKNQELIWAKLLERVANTASARAGHHQWLSLQAYPALLLMYAGGVAAIANEKFSTLEALLLKPRLIGADGDSRLVDRLSAAAVIEDDRLTNLLVGGEAHPAPLSAYLCAYLRDRFREFVPSDDVYDDIFDHFEYMFSLVWIDENPIGASLGWVPLGRFAWRHLSGLQTGGSIVGRIGAEVSQMGKDWPALRAGLFGGSMQRFVSARNRVATFMGSQR
jgi:hypothetical protein